MLSYAVMSTQVTYPEAIKHFGSAAEMARRLEIKPQAIYQWGGEIPKLREYQIADLIKADKEKDSAA
jgi:transcriptional repressor of cell division inhibition gene dicB